MELFLLKLIGASSPRVLGAASFREVEAGSSTTRGRLEATASLTTMEEAFSKASVGGTTSTVVLLFSASGYWGECGGLVLRMPRFSSSIYLAIRFISSVPKNW